jgi:hypothetical protein
MKNILIAVVVAIIIIAGAVALGRRPGKEAGTPTPSIPTPVAAQIAPQ